MALPVTCACGAAFEVADTFAGQAVSCPECHAPARVPRPGGGPVRTSGYAVASVVLALVGAFTVILTVLAVVFGAAALVQIKRRGRSVVGVGYSVFGIVLGLVFTALSLFAYSRGELFGLDAQLREQMWRGEVRRGGPLEVVRADHGFAVTRPTQQWGVASPKMTEQVAPDYELLLANLRHDAYVGVRVADDLREQKLEDARETVLDGYRDTPERRANAFDVRRTGFKLTASRRFAAADTQRIELAFESRVNGQLFSYVVHVVRESDGDRTYIVDGWMPARRATQVEAEIRRALDSFRVLPP